MTHEIMWSPYGGFVGGFSPNDGTIDFYSRIATLVDKRSVVVDLGAGRAAWFEDDDVGFRRSARDLRLRVGRLIAADVDEAVLANAASHENLLIEGGVVPLADESVDVVIADFVLEHVEDPARFVAEVDRLLRPGGWFCARTPHRWNYVAIGARLVANAKHAKLLSFLQPERKEGDVFPTAYRMNTLRAVEGFFGAAYCNRSFLARSDPAYYLGSRVVFSTLNVLHRLAPAFLSSALFIFLQKDGVRD